MTRRGTEDGPDPANVSEIPRSAEETPPRVEALWEGGPDSARYRRLLYALMDPGGSADQADR